MIWPILRSWVRHGSWATCLWTWAPRSPRVPCAIHCKNNYEHILMYLNNEMFIRLYLPGQLLVLHEDDSDKEPEQSVPPWNGPFLDLVRVLDPEPHVFVQNPHDPQIFQLQSTKKAMRCVYSMVRTLISNLNTVIEPWLFHYPGKFECCMVHFQWYLLCS